MEFVPRKYRSSDEIQSKKARSKTVQEKRPKKGDGNESVRNFVKAKRDVKTLDAEKPELISPECKPGVETSVISKKGKKVVTATNRLFVHMKKKILNEEMVKALHRDIVSVTFPRKKNSKWCWAVFQSEAKAKAALTKLENVDGVVVKAPTSATEKIKHKTKKVVKSKERKRVKTQLINNWL